MKQRLVSYLVILTLISSIYARDDDIDFADSLGRHGYDWIAVEEFKKLGQTRDPVENVRQLLALARYYESRMDYVRRDRFLDEFLKQAENMRHPWVQREYNRVLAESWGRREQTLMQEITKLETLLAEDDPDTKQISKIRENISTTGTLLRDFRVKQVKSVQEELENPDTEIREFELDRAEFELSHALFLFSYSYKGVDEEKRRNLLERVLRDYLDKLDFMYGDHVIGIPQLRGQILWELEDYEKAASAFEKCIDFRADIRISSIRLHSYMKAVESYWKLKKYMDICTVGSSFLIEFPSKESRATPRGQAVRYYLARAVDHLSDAEFDKVKEILGFRKGKQESVIALLQEVYREGGNFSTEARREIAAVRGDFRNELLKGEEHFMKGEYDSAIISLQNGLKHVPGDLDPRQRITELPQGWYYLGMAYYKKDRLEQSLICFKEGSLRFADDIRRMEGYLPDDEKKWYEKNSENWRLTAGMFFKKERNGIALSAYREALEYAKNTGSGTDENIHLTLAVLLMQNSDYTHAIDELGKITAESAEYERSIGLRGTCSLGIYRETGKTSYLDDAEKHFTEYMAAINRNDEAETGREKARVEYELMRIDFYRKDYRSVLKRGEFFSRECAYEDISYSAFSFLVNASLRVAGAEESADPDEKETALAGSLKLIDSLEKKKPGDPVFQTARRQIALAFTNLSTAFRKQGDTEGSSRCAKTAGKLIAASMSDLAAVPEGELAAASELLFSVLKDYSRSIPVFDELLNRCTARTAGQFNPYNEKARNSLIETGKSLLDRAESRAKWKIMADRIFDGKDHDRDYFRERRESAWEELPYNYESAFVLLSEVLMAELGYDPARVRKEAGKRDSRDPETVEGFWSGLFSEYRRQTGRDTASFEHLRSFLEDRILANNTMFKLSECCGFSGKLKKAVEYARILDDYYLVELSAKLNLGSLLLRQAEETQDKREKQIHAFEAKDIFVWIKNRTLSGPAGKIDHYEAVIMIARAYETAGDFDSAFGEIQYTIQYGTVDYPPGYEKKMKQLLEYYRKMKTGAGE